MEKKLISNKLLLVLSFAVAVIIWIYVIITVDPETTAKVGPLNIQYLASVPMQQKDIEIIGEISEKVELTVKGNRSYVTGSKANYSAIIDLSQISQSGYYTVPIDVRSPGGVSVLEQKPTTLNIHVDTWKTAEKKVVLSQFGTPKAGYGVTHVSTFPEKLNVQAPSLILDKISYLEVGVDLENAEKTFTATVPIEAYDDTDAKLAMDHIHLPQQNYSLEIGIGKVKTVPVTPTIAGVDMSRYNMIFTAEPADITVTAGDEVLEKLTAVSTHTITLPNEAGVHSVDALLDLPTGAYLTEGQPNTIHFDITITEKDHSYGN